MYAQSVTIGSEFFVKSFNDYRDKFWAFAREIMQNSIDCGSTSIDIKIVEVPDDDCTLVVVRNDGEPMTREILVGKLLSLGSSGKDFQGAVGGFGKAKEILYFAHRSYTIASGVCRVSGSGAGYNLEEGTFFHGTRSAVVWGGLVAEPAGTIPQVHRTLRPQECTFTIDGEPVRPQVPRFHFERPLVHEGKEWAHLGVSQVRGEPAPGADRGSPDVRRADRLQEDARAGVAGGQRRAADGQPRQPALPAFDAPPRPDHADGRGPSLGPEA